MDLVELPQRPIPEGARAGMVTTPDGVPLRYARWDATEAPRRGTIVIAQGRAEFIEKYFDVVDRLRARGFGVLVFDWRGQGGSGRLLPDIGKGHVRHFSDYQIDLETIMTVIGLPDCRPPFHALGHSMGAALLADAAKEGRTWFDRMVLSAPMVGLANLPFELGVRALARSLDAIGFGHRLIPGGSSKPITQKPFASNPVTSDAMRYALTAAYADIDRRLGLGAPTIGWLAGAFAFMDKLMHPLYPVEIRQPILVVAAGADPLVSTPAIETFAKRLKAGRAIVIDGAKHELMMECDPFRAQFFAAFDAFVPGEQAYL